MKKIVLTVAALALSAGAAFAAKPDAEVINFLRVQAPAAVTEQVKAAMQAENGDTKTYTDGSANHFGDHGNS